MKKILNSIILFSLMSAPAFAAPVSGNVQVDVFNWPGRGGMGPRQIAKMYLYGDAAGALYQMLNVPEIAEDRGPGDFRHGPRMTKKISQDLICYRKLEFGRDRRSDFFGGERRYSYSCETRVNAAGEVERRGGRDRWDD